MKLTDLIKRAGRSLGNAKARTLLTSLAIGVGAFTLTLTLAAGEGANQYAKKLISSNFDPSEVFIAKDKKIFGSDTSGFSSPQEYDESAILNGGISIKRIDEQDIEAIKKIEGITSVRPQYQLTPLYFTREGAKKYTGSLSSYSSSQKPEFATGSAPDKLADNEILLPDSYIPLLGFSSNDDAVGKTVNVFLRRNIQINPEQIQQAIASGGLSAINQLSPYESKTVTFTIKGVTKKSPTTLLAAVPLYISETTAASLNDFATEGTPNYRKFTIVFADVKNGEQKAERDKVAALLEAKGFNVTTAEDTQEILLQFIGVLQGIVGGFGAIALIASVFGIINTQYISVLERTREIGLMKALGMRGRHVSRLFQFEAAWIGFLGGLIGSGLAIGAGTLLNPWISKTLELGDNNSLLIFQPIPIISLIVILMVIAMIAGWFPARKAAKLDPIEALRTE